VQCYREGRQRRLIDLRLAGLRKAILRLPSPFETRSRLANKRRFPLDCTWVIVLALDS